MKALVQLRGAVRGLVVGAARRLPDGAVLELMSSLSLLRKLDYPGQDLFLNVRSPEEYFIRLGSCRKEPETVEWLEASVREGDVFYDIGANVGAYTLIASKLAGGRAKVYAFEPGFANYAQLCYNLQLNRSQNNVVPVPIALSDKTQFSSFVFGNLNPGKSAHLSVEGASLNGKIEHTVPTWRLDDLVRDLGMEPPTLIKIDVDGAERSVLAGARDTLRHPALRALQVELETDETVSNYLAVVELLREAGFSLEAKYAHSRYANYLFVRQAASPSPSTSSGE